MFLARLNGGRPLITDLFFVALTEAVLACRLQHLFRAVLQRLAPLFYAGVWRHLCGGKPQVRMLTGVRYSKAHLSGASLCTESSQNMPHCQGWHDRLAGSQIIDTLRGLHAAGAVPPYAAYITIVRFDALTEVVASSASTGGTRVPRATSRTCSTTSRRARSTSSRPGIRTPAS